MCDETQKTIQAFKRAVLLPNLHFCRCLTSFKSVISTLFVVTVPASILSSSAEKYQANVCVPSCVLIKKLYLFTKISMPYLLL